MQRGRRRSAACVRPELRASSADVRQWADDHRRGHQHRLSARPGGELSAIAPHVAVVRACPAGRRAGDGGSALHAHDERLLLRESGAGGPGRTPIPTAACSTAPSILPVWRRPAWWTLGFPRCSTWFRRRTTIPGRRPFDWSKAVRADFTVSAAYTYSRARDAGTISDPYGYGNIDSRHGVRQSGARNARRVGPRSAPPSRDRGNLQGAVDQMGDGSFHYIRRRIRRAVHADGAARGDR